MMGELWLSGFWTYILSFYTLFIVLLLNVLSVFYVVICKEAYFGGGSLVWRVLCFWDLCCLYEELDGFGANSYLRCISQLN